MTRVKFAALLVALVIGCTSLGSVASYYLNFFWYAAAEPIVYPCPYPGNAGVCSQNAEPTRSRSSRVAYYGWPSIDPIHIHFQPQRSCVLDFLYHDPLPQGTLRGEQQ